MLNKREKNQTWNITAKDKHDKALHRQQYVPFVHGSQESLHCSKISSSTKVPLALSKLELLPAPPSNPTETNCHCNTFDQLLRCNFRYCNLASESFKRMTKKWICMSSESVNYTLGHLHTQGINVDITYIFPEFSRLKTTSLSFSLFL